MQRLFVVPIYMIGRLHFQSQVDIGVLAIFLPVRSGPGLHDLVLHDRTGGPGHLHLEVPAAPSPQRPHLTEGKARVCLEAAEDLVDLPVGPVSSHHVGHHPHQALVLLPQPLVVTLEVGQGLEEIVLGFSARYSVNLPCQSAAQTVRSSRSKLYYLLCCYIDSHVILIRLMMITISFM